MPPYAVAGAGLPGRALGAGPRRPALGDRALGDAARCRGGRAPGRAGARRSARRRRPERAATAPAHDRCPGAPATARWPWSGRRWRRRTRRSLSAVSVSPMSSGVGNEHGLVPQAAQRPQQPPVAGQLGLAGQAGPEVLGHGRARAAAAVHHQGQFGRHGVTADQGPQVPGRPAGEFSWPRHRHPYQQPARRRRGFHPLA